MTFDPNGRRSHWGDLCVLAVLACSGCTPPEEQAEKLALSTSVLDAWRPLPVGYRPTLSAGAVRVRNPKQLFDVQFEEGRVRVTRDGAQPLSLELAALRCQERAGRVGGRAGVPQLEQQGVVFSHDEAGLLEWYRNTPQGLEQGFELQRDPGCADAPLVVEIGVAAPYRAVVGGTAPWYGRTPWQRGASALGTTAAELGEAKELEFVSEGGTSFGYKKLFAYDATGASLPATMEAAGDKVRLKVDLRGAHYPIVIDPLIVSAPAPLLWDAPEANDGFGSAIALNDAGDVMAVGTPRDQGPSARAGAVMVFARNGSAAWHPLQRLRSPLETGIAGFGTAVAVSSTEIAVGAPGVGRVFVYSLQGGVWQLSQELSGLTGFGGALTLVGDTLIVGADTAFSGQGRVYVFTRQEQGFAVAQTLSCGALCSATAGLGSSVSLSPDGVQLVVAADQHDGVGANSGAVLVFRRQPDGSYLHDVTLESASPAAGARFGHVAASARDRVCATSGQATGGQLFERSAQGTWSSVLTASEVRASSGCAMLTNVAAFGDVAFATPAAGAGRARVYIRDAGGWAFSEQLAPTTPVAQGQYGSVLALTGGLGTGNTVLVVGAPGETALGYGTGAGAAYVYKLDGDVAFQLETRGVEPAPEQDDRLGCSVSTTGSDVFVGACGDFGGAGAVYWFSLQAGVWRPQQKLMPLERAPGDQFGFSIASEAGRLLVGAPGEEADRGAAYVLTSAAGSFAVTRRLQAASGSPGDRYGEAIAGSASSVVVGSPARSSVSTNQGAAYAYRTSDFAEAMLPAAPGINAEDRVGAALAVAGDTLVVGAPGYGDGAGAALVYSGANQVWTFSDALEVAGSGELGTSIGLAGDELIVGAPGDSQSAADAGSFSHFHRGGGGTWTLVDAGLAPPGVAAGDRHGHALALSGSVAVVSSPEVGNQAGAIYGYELTGGSFGPAEPIANAAAVAGAELGGSVALRGALAVVGVPGSHALATNAGQGFVHAILQPDGGACLDEAQCQSGYCAEGVCCDALCGEACETCLAARGASSDGVCTIAAPGDAGNPRCEHPYQCDGVLTSCPNRCATDVSCLPGFFCEAASSDCKPLGDLGADCRRAGDEACASGICEDGVCCERVCGTCAACRPDLHGDVALTAGTCAPVLAGTDPRDDCAADADYPESCGPDGECDGAGACRPYALTATPCGATTCSEETNSIVGPTCTGDGAVCNTPPEGTPCEPYLCRAGACTQSCTDDDDCDPLTGKCDTTSGECQGRLDEGAQCMSDSSCASGHCVDGVCCDRACEDQCAACDLVLADGTDLRGVCSPVFGEPRGNRPACDGGDDDDACSARSCDGSETQTCAGFVSDVVCGAGACDESSYLPPPTCDGNGECVAGDRLDCGRYLCGDQGCLGECEDDQDCAEFSVCDDGQCTGGVTCSEDGSQAFNADGEALDCEGHRCQEGVCPERCLSQNGCLVGYLCNSAGRCVDRSLAEASRDAGCGCRLHSSGRRTQAWLVLVGLVALWRRRRIVARIG